VLKPFDVKVVLELIAKRLKLSSMARVAAA